MKYIKTKFNQFIKENQTTKIFYHGTSDNNYDDIIKNGLKNVYLTDYYEKAEYYAEVTCEDIGGDPIIFQVSINDLENLRVDYAELDEPVCVGDMGFSETRDLIQNYYNQYAKDHPEKLNKKFNTIQVEPKDYTFSLETVHSVKYEGVITPDKITLI